MKVLWITNMKLPPICKRIQQPVIPLCGWLYGAAISLFESNPDLELCIATGDDRPDILEEKIDGITYTLIPYHGDVREYHSQMERYWIDLKERFQPDIIHIHGTEYAFGLAYLRACGKEHVVVSIQGLIGASAKYYFAGMTLRDIISSITFRDIATFNTLFRRSRSYGKRVKMEHEYLNSIENVIGRTEWDKAHVWAVNDQIKYHFCNETLRPSFYKHHWSYCECEPHTIFVSQASYPIKGLHQILKALFVVKKYYPDVKLYVAGTNIIDESTFYKRIKIFGYARYLISLIHQFGLQNNVFFVGTLSEQEICQYYLRSNLFISSSAIENSSNSLCEAQLMGVPYLASNVGGTHDLVHDEDIQYLYQFEEVEILANKICRIFDNKDKNIYINRGVKERHDPKANVEATLKIYNQIVNQ